MNELAVKFDCKGSSLFGVLHQAQIKSKVGVIIVVAGGPQYRAGVSRQFVMLGRLLASQGIPTLRFDHRGTGDSEGKCLGFIDMNDDIHSAVDELIKKNPDIEKVLLWGECESASALTFYAHTDARIAGVFLVNPWIRTEGGEAKTYIKHYYLDRLMKKELWLKIFSGKFSFVDSFKSFFNLVNKAKNTKVSQLTSINQSLSHLALPQRVEQSVSLFKGNVFILTSGNDLIAQEFKDFVATSKQWQLLIKQKNYTWLDIADADHSFSRSDWRKEMLDSVTDWVQAHVVDY